MWKESIVMVRRIAVVVAGVCLFAAPLKAQRVEIGAGGGYTLSEGIRTDERVFNGGIYDRAEVNSGASFNLSFGVFASPAMMIEFLYGKQMSKLTAEGLGGKLDVADLNVDNYHGNFVYHWGESDAKMRPFAMIGFGATHYSFGTVQVPGPGQGREIPGNTQFSTTWGGGVKFYATPNVGFKFTARWTPTYIKTDEAGYWCDPFYGCWVVGDPDYSHQFDLSGGIVIRF
jgi:opacity protein-like surface antigen